MSVFVAGFYSFGSTGGNCAALPVATFPMTPNPVALHLEEPLSIDEARHAARAMALQRLVEEAAQAESEYRKAFSEAFINATGTAGEREAKAKAASAAECYRRDVAAGMVKVGTERLRGLEGERAMLRALIEWSSRLRLDEKEVIGGQVYGRRPQA